MRFRGLMTICVLTAAVFVAAAAPAMAQDANKPAPSLVKPPANTASQTPAAAGKDTSNFGPNAGEIPVEKAPGTSTPKAGKATTKPSSNKPGPTQGPDSYLFIILLGGVVLMWIWMGRGQRKRKAKRQEMLAALKKGDKIVTIGGIIGTIIEVRSDEVTVKVDETNNVRMKFTRGAISGVGEEAKTAEDDR